MDLSTDGGGAVLSDPDDSSRKAGQDRDALRRGVLFIRHAKDTNANEAISMRYSSMIEGY